MLKENLKDAAQILFNILHQPLEVGEEKEKLSLIRAAQSFSADGTNTQLSKILENFAKYPEPTETLVRELDLLIGDIKQ